MAPTNASGTIHLNKNQKLYIGVGGIGKSGKVTISSTKKGGYTGGKGGGSYTGGQGGSSYVGGVTNGSTIDGNSEMPTFDGTSTMTGNSTSGYTKITYIGA